ncbi:MAG: hypothetical protein ACXAEU_05545 [Candidatus Hodarchaeales archaeon]|jgi:hypothetical protein
MLRAGLFEREQEELRRFLKEERNYLDDEVSTILETFLEMVSDFPEAVRDIDFSLEELREYMAEKAEEFYEKFKKTEDTKEGKENVKIEKDSIYIYEYSSIFLVQGMINLLYPYMLVRAANYLNFVHLLCNGLRRLEHQIEFTDFLEIFDTLYTRCKPKLLKWDIDIIEGITKLDFTKNDYFKIVKKYEKNPRFIRLKHLGIPGFFTAINFPAIGLIPYMHLAHHATEVPDDLKPFIEGECHPGKRKHGYQVFRVFLLPLKLEKALIPLLRECGTIFGEIDEWYNRYNLDSLTRTGSGTWKWKIDSSSLANQARTDYSKFHYLIKMLEPEKITTKFVSYLEVIHSQGFARISDLSIITGISLHTLKKFQKKAVNGKFVLPDVQISRLGLSSYYQVCFRNTRDNQQLVKLFEMLPRVRVMKSNEFYRYLLFLPAVVAKKINSWLIEKEEQGEFEIISRQPISYLEAKSIYKGVNLSRTWKMMEKISN